jgi:hypothetical protein
MTLVGRRRPGAADHYNRKRGKRREQQSNLH